jgi:hypothetical protein
MLTFHGEVAFVPLIVLPAEALPSLESLVLAELLALHPSSGTAREWFWTTGCQAIAELVWRVSGVERIS